LAENFASRLFSLIVRIVTVNFLFLDKKNCQSGLFGRSKFGHLFLSIFEIRLNYEPSFSKISPAFDFRPSAKKTEKTAYGFDKKTKNNECK